MYTLERPNLLVYVLARIVSSLRYRGKRFVEGLRYVAFYHRFGSIGEDVILHHDIDFNKPENIKIGDQTFIGKRTRLNAVEEITIGENCLIAADTYFMTWNHRIDNREVSLRTTGKEAAPIRVGDGVWVGYNAIILPGVTINDGAVVAAGAVVADDVPPFSIVGGVPAEQLGERTEDGIE